MTPTADDIAVAIVAACRETGESPVKVGGRVLDKAKARHYAVHALLHVFPKASAIDLCRLVGVPRNYRQFWIATRIMIREKQQPCSWWSEEAYGRVILAIEADRTRRAVTPSPVIDHQEPSEPTVAVSAYVAPPPYQSPAKPRPAAPLPRQGLGALEPEGYRPPKGTADAILRDDKETGPVFDRGRFGPEPDKAPKGGGKADLYAELAKAAANTKPRAED